MFFRLLVLFFTILAVTLTPWAIVGSYKNASHLTNNYLIGVQVTGLDVGALFAGNQKRDAVVNLPLDNKFVDAVPTPTTTERAYTTSFEKKDLADDIQSLVGGLGTEVSSAIDGIDLDKLTADAASATSQIADAIDTDAIISDIGQLASSVNLPDAVATLAEGLANGLSIEQAVSNLEYHDLGFADYYSISYWGYCRGYMRSLNNSDDLISNLGDFGKNFNQDKVNYVWCSLPVAGYKFDPLELVKREMSNAVRDEIDGVNGLPLGISGTLKAQLIALIASVDYETLNLPGELQDMLGLLNNITTAGLAMLIAGAGLGFISLIFQLVGLVSSPRNSCLSCLNYILMLLFFLCILLGAGLTTGVYMFARKEVNNHIDEFGLKSYLSIQYYAFAWSAMAASFMAVVLAALGYCCGCFHGNGKRKYKRVDEPNMAYDHKGYQ